VNQHGYYLFDDFVVDLEAWQLLHADRVVHLEPTVLKLLVYLIEHRDRLVAKDELLNTVWGDTVVSESALSKAIARLRKALGDDFSQARYVETVHSLGYRFIAEVREREGTTEPRTFAARAQRGLWIVLGVAGLLAVLILLDPFAMWSSSSGEVEKTRIRSLAVLPLVNLTGEPEKDYFVEGLHDVLITNLSKITDLRVISRQSTMRYRGSDMTLPSIARELNVDALVEGGALLLDGKVKVNAQLIDGYTDEHIWAQTYDRDLKDVMALLGEIAGVISSEIRITLGPSEVARLALADSVDPAANDAYLRGLYQISRFAVADIRKALSSFEQAVALDPEFAPAWSGVAAAKLMLAYRGYGPPRDSLNQARVAAFKALELDDQFFAGYAALGWVKLFTWDWPGAGQAFEEALRLNPNHPTTIHGYADFLMLTGRVEESLTQVRRARSIDPFTPASSLPVPTHLFMMRRYDESIAEARRLLEQDPGYPVHWLLAMAYWQKGMLVESVAAFREDLANAGDTELLAALDRGTADSGPHAAMRLVAAEMAGRSEAGYADPFKIASTYAQAGDIDQAFEWLEEAVDSGSLELIYIGLRPDFDLLREDARFTELLHRLGFPALQ